MDIKNSAVFAAYNNTGKLTNAASDKASGVDFGNMVSQTLDNTSKTLHKAESLGNGILVDNVSLEELAAAVSNAEVTLKAVTAVRDRIINAYQDIIKMPI